MESQTHSIANLFARHEVWIVANLIVVVVLAAGWWFGGRKAWGVLTLVARKAASGT